MRDVVVLVDSTADLDKEKREQHKIEYIQMRYIIDDVKYPASLDWENHSAKEFYDIMRNGKRIQTTQVPAHIYEEIFQKYIKKGIKIIYVACSSALSGSVNLAKKIVMDMGVENEIAVVDSLCSSLGQGHMAITASKMISEGKSFEETVEFLEKNKLNVNQFGTVASLEYLRRSGRVKAQSAFFGNILGIKPIIISDINGQNYAIEKVKGAVNAKKRIAELLKDVSEGYDRENLYISHADALSEAQALKELILERVEFKNVHIGTIGPIVGSCVGPGTIIAFCDGKKVTVEGE